MMTSETNGSRAIERGLQHVSPKLFGWLCSRSVWLWAALLLAGLITLADLVYPAPATAQSDPPEMPFILPFTDPPGPNSWLLAQPYGNTVGAFRQRNTTYANSGGIHFGVDFSAPCGTPLVAMADGVVFAVDNMRFGSAPHNLMLDHPDLGYATFYGHLFEAPALNVGQVVQAGDVIALSGDPAETCYGRPHLHLEIRDLAHIRKYNPVLLVQADWDNMALIGSFGQAFQYDLDQPRKWQHLDDQPEASAGGPLLNDFANPWPPDFPVQPRAAASPAPAAIAGSDSQVGTIAPPGKSAASAAHAAPEPASPALQQLTTGGCCTQVFWSPDAQSVLFIDRPTLTRPAGIWAVDTGLLGPARLFSERIAFYTANLAYRLVLQGNTTSIELLSQPAGPASQRWNVPARGRLVSLSPNRTRIAWQISDESVPVESRNADIWIANLDGSQARSVASLARGSILAWASDDVLIVSGRESRQSREQVFWAVALSDGGRTELARSDRLRGGVVSPDGTWLAYFIALSESSTQNGLWLVRTDATHRIQLGPELFGAYEWRDADRLLVIPLEPEAISHTFWEYDVRSGTARRLTDPEVTPLKVANNDWAVSPDGRYVAFVESRDDNIYRLTLPD
jgi:murein DD-endopeptidase MepM/ murein hydrolase activator NlpD